jgi:hypothetical protein
MLQDRAAMARSKMDAAAINHLFRCFRPESPTLLESGSTMSMECRLTTKFSDRTLTFQHAGARQQAAREARPPAAEHFMVVRLAATPS